jgi:hypothetical protein
MNSKNRKAKRCGLKLFFYFSFAFYFALVSQSALFLLDPSIIFPLAARSRASCDKKER